MIMKTLSSPLTRAWIALMLLSFGSTVLAAFTDYGLSVSATGGLILLLALLKARVILSRYLGLWQAPSWNRGFNWVLSLFCLALFGLYLIPSLA